MKKINNTYDLIEVIEKYHSDRCHHYEEILSGKLEPMTKLLIEKLLELEKRSLSIVVAEKSKMDPKSSPYMSSGPTLSTDPEEASKCKHSLDITFQSSLDCVFKSDVVMDSMLERLEFSTSTPSISDLAIRLKEIQQIKNQQISNYVRME